MRYLFCFLLVTCFIDTLSASVIKAINCGESKPLDSPNEGFSYMPDAPYSQEVGYGYVGDTAKPDLTSYLEYAQGGIDLASEFLFFRNRLGTEGYRIDLPNGIYVARLIFTEPEKFAAGKRVFSVTIEDSLHLQDMDIYARVRKNYPHVYRTAVEVKDGSLDIGFVKNVGEPCITAIVIYDAVPDKEPPAPPSVIEKIGGFAMNIMDLAPYADEDFAGFNAYRIENGEKVRINDGLIRESRFIDHDAEPGKEYSYVFTAADVWGNESSFSEEVTVVPVDHASSPLPVYELTFTDAGYARLRDNLMNDTKVRCDFTYNGKTWKNIEARSRGNSTRKWDKNNFKLEFDDDDKFEGMEDINLSALATGGFIEDELFFYLKRRHGLVTFTTKFIHLKINGRYAGLYYYRDQEDENFADMHGIPPFEMIKVNSGTLHKRSEADYYDEGRYEKQSLKDGDMGHFIDLINFVNDSDDETFRGDLHKYVDVRSYLVNLAIVHILADNDHNGHNQMFYRSLKDNKWYFLTYDHNFSLTNSYQRLDFLTEHDPLPSVSGGDYGYAALFNRLYNIEEFRLQYLREVAATYDMIKGDGFGSLVDSLFGIIEYDALRDILKAGSESSAYLHFKRDWIKKFWNIRDVFLEPQLASLPEQYVGGSLFINEVCVSNTSYPDNEGSYLPWLEIYNDSPLPADIGGMILEYAGHAWKFPAGTRITEKGFLVLHAGGKTGGGHLPFLIEAEGIIDLKEKNGALIHQFDTHGMESAGSLGLDNANATTSMRHFPYPTPGRFNKDMQGFQRSLVINEAMTSNKTTIRDENKVYPDWIEIYNTGNGSMDIGGYYLSDDASLPYKWRLPADEEIAGRGFKLVWAGNDKKKDNLVANYSLPAKGAMLGLFTPAGDLMDTLRTGVQADDVSTGRAEDGGEASASFAEATPGGSNEDIRSFLRINELKTNNTALANWIELFNAADDTLNISGIIITDDNGKWAFPQGTLIGPGGYEIIFDTDKGLVNEETLGYSISDSPVIKVTDVTARQVIDSIAIWEVLNGGSIGRDADGTGSFITMQFPTPGFSNSLSGIPFFEEEIKPAPNPADHYVTFTAGNILAGKLLIYDARGCLITSVGGIGAGKWSLDVSAMPAGKYMACLSDGRKIVATGAFVIMR